MSPIKDQIVSNESAKQTLVKVYEVCSEGDLRSLSVGLGDAVCELIRWRYPIGNAPFSDPNINDALAVLTTIKGAVDAAIESKTKERLARWNAMEGAIHE